MQTPEFSKWNTDGERGILAFIAGGAVAGRNTGNIFIENGRFHGETIIKVLADRRLQEA
jgi:hypothetical protein